MFPILPSYTKKLYLAEGNPSDICNTIRVVAEFTEVSITHLGRTYCMEINGMAEAYMPRSLDTISPLELKTCAIDPANVDISKELRMIEAYTDMLNSRRSHKSLRIERVIFNDPATIVFWSDGDKTVVKAVNEAYDPEKGLAMAVTKKLLGHNKGNYYNELKKWLPSKEVENIDTD